MPDTTDFEYLLEMPNVVGVNYNDATDTVETWVARKKPRSELTPTDLVSESVPDGQQTDVTDAGLNDGDEGFAPEILDPDNPPIESQGDRHTRHRPVQSGLSEIHYSSTAATAGHYPARVTDTTKGVWDEDVEVGDRVRISNCHVYAQEGNAEMGDSILQPSPYDDGRPKDETGTLAGYLPLEHGVRADVAARTVDETIDTARPHTLPAEWPSSIERDPPAVGDTLIKTGRTTGVTEGDVIAVGASVRVRYDRGAITLRDQILTEDMSTGGDSGSPAFDTDGGLRGVLCAGSSRVTVHSLVGNAETDFGLKLMADTQTHEPEETFEDWAEQRLKDQYGESNVERQVHLQTDRRIDLLVTDTERECQWALELENDSGSVLNGKGQCTHYAHRITKERPENGAGIPVLGVPEGHIDADEKQDFMEEGVVVWEFDLPGSVSIQGV